MLLYRYKPFFSEIITNQRPNQNRIALHIQSWNSCSDPRMKMQLFSFKRPGCELPDIRTQFDRHGAFSWICSVRGNNSVASLHVSYFLKLTQHSPPAVRHRISNLFDLVPALPCSWARNNSLLTFILRINGNNPKKIFLKPFLRVKGVSN